MKKVLVIIMIILLCLASAGCGRSGANVFRNRAEKPLIKQKTISYFSNEDSSTPTSVQVRHYNEKGLLESIDYDGKPRVFGYQYDEQGSPTSITMLYDGVDTTFPITNVYEGKTVKEARVDLLDHAKDFPMDPDDWDKAKVVYYYYFVDCLENCVNYRDATFSIIGTQVFMERSNGEMIHQCIPYGVSLQKTDVETEEDGSKSVRVVRLYTDFTTTTFYDAQGRIIRIEMKDGLQNINIRPVIFGYMMDRDNETGHTIYKGVSKSRAIQYEFADDRMLVMEQSPDGGFTREVTTYTEEGQIAMYETYMDGALSRREEYEYR